MHIFKQFDFKKQTKNINMFFIEALGFFVN